MHTRYLLVLVSSLLCFTQSIQAQKDPMKWGKIDDEDLSLTHYSTDESAEALILGDYGRVSFEIHPDKGLRYKLERHVRIKVFNSEGTDWANVEIPLYGRGIRQEEIGQMRAIAYNKVGGKIEKTKMSRSEGFEEEVYDFLTLYKFSIPNTKAGSVIEYEYTLYSKYLANLVNWKFQEQIPTRWSELRVRIPEFFTYRHYLSGYRGLDINEQKFYPAQLDDFAGTAYRWVMKDVPALEPEPFITTLSDYAARMQFELKVFSIPGYAMENYGTDWNKLNEEFMESSSFGKQLKGGRWAEELVATITAGATKEDEKLLRIHTYVQQNFRYNGINRLYPGESLKKIAEKKEGNAAELNLLLTTLLRAAGLTANPVILSTRNHGRVNPFLPIENDFNYVIACAELAEGKILLDATEDLLPAGQLPFRCLNGQGRLLSEGGSHWVPLLNREKHAVAVKAELKLSKNGLLTGTMEQQTDGFIALSQRKKLLLDGEDKFFQSVAEKHQNWSVSDYAFTNIKNAGEKLEARYTMVIEGKSTPAGDRMYLDPIPVGKIEENPFRQDSRIYPIDFGCPDEQTLMYSFELPEGFSVESLPQSALLALPEKAGMFRYQVSQMGNKVVVMSMFSIKRPLFGAEEYAFLKQFYAQVIEKQNEQIVLVKAKVSAN